MVFNATSNNISAISWRCLIYEWVTNKWILYEWVYLSYFHEYREWLWFSCRGNAIWMEVFFSEWMRDYCLTPIQQFSAISWREQVNFQWDDDEVRFDLHADLKFYSASSLKQQSAGRHVAPLEHIILTPSHCSFSSMLRA